MDFPGIELLKELSKDVKLYIVGGTVRDLLIDKEPVDIDIAIEGDISKFVRVLSRKVSGPFFLMDEENLIYRIINKLSPPPLYFDVAPLRDRNILSDLSYRDFTIDAMAIDIKDPDLIIDPFKGQEDLKVRCVRVLSKKAFEADPLRLLRAYRLASTLNFTIDSTTEDLIRTLAPLIRNVARERIRDEFFKILSVEPSYNYLQAMYYSGLLENIFYPLPKDDLLEGIEWLKYFELYLSRVVSSLKGCKNLVNQYMNTYMEDEITKKLIIKWMSFCIPNYFPLKEIREFAQDFKLSSKSIKMILTIIRNIDDLRILEDKNRLTFYNFFTKLDEDGIGTILVHLISAKWKGTLSSSLLDNACDAICWFKEVYKPIKEMPLVTGKDIRELGIPPGPVYGKLLKIIEKERAIGRISSKSEALSFLKEILQKQTLNLD